MPMEIDVSRDKGDDVPEEELLQVPRAEKDLDNWEEEEMER